METEFIREQAGGATSVKFKDLTTEELRLRFWTFPEAQLEYTKRFLEAQTIPKSG